MKINSNDKNPVARFKLDIDCRKIGHDPDLGRSYLKLLNSMKLNEEIKPNNIKPNKPDSLLEFKIRNIGDF